jgi:3-oxoacyl-[acyl-carrier protein] reductase
MASWAKTLATELGNQGITVNSILPGFTSTERLNHLIDSIAKSKNISTDEVENQLNSQIPLGRFVKPEEVAYFATFLASEYSTAINGTALAVDGGYLRTI